MKLSVVSHYKLLHKYLRPHSFKMLLLTLLLGISIGIQLLNPRIVKFFIDSALSQKEISKLTSAAIIFVAMAAFNQLIVIITTYVAQNIGWVSTNSLRLDLMEHCMKLDLSFHKMYKPGELIERIDGDVLALFNFFSKLLLQLLNNTILIAGILILLFFEDYRVGIAVSTLAATALVVLWKLQKASIPYQVAESRNNAEFYGFLGEQVSSTEDIKAMGGDLSVIMKLKQILKERFHIHKRAVMRYCLMWTTTIALFSVGTIVSLGLGAYLWSKGIITIGSIFLIFNYTELLNRPIEQIRRQLMDLQKASASIIRIEELLSIETKLINGGSCLLTTNPVDIAFDNVSFGYENNTTVLKNISFKVKKGRVLGVIGKTGSGKTTLARLLMRLYDTGQGRILLDNMEIKEVSLENLRQHIGFVTQDVQLFNATIRENLTFFNDAITDEEILEIIVSLGMEHWLKSLPKGLDTKLDSQGGGLSAGEAQLLAFVRVFLKRPSIIVLDEASSRLDPITEQLLDRAVDSLLKNRTCLIIAHRLNTLKRADDILILEEGVVVEYGNRRQLELDQESRFYKLLKAGIEGVLA